MVKADEKNAAQIDARGEVKAFAAIRKIHKKPGIKVLEYMPSPGLVIRIQRTPEEQAAHEATIMREAELFSMAAFLIAGRKENTVSPIRKLIASLLKKNPASKNAELWLAVAAKPPKGWTACDNHAGKYIEGAKPGQNMNYERFCNICSEERRSLKK